MIADAPMAAIVQVNASAFDRWSYPADGGMDTCIVLRTAIVKDGKMYVPAGLVADSDPQSEQNECVSKAKALFRAGEDARRFASQVGRGQ